MEPLHSFVFPSVFVDHPILSEYVDELKIVSLPTCVIVRIMGRGDLDSTRSKLSINEIICNDFHLSFGNEWMNQLLANILFVSFVFGIYGNCAISQHSLDPCCGDNNLFGWIIFELICKINNNSKFNILFISRDLYESSLLKLLEFDLNIRYSSF